MDQHATIEWLDRLVSALRDAPMPTDEAHELLDRIIEVGSAGLSEAFPEGNERALRYARELERLRAGRTDGDWLTVRGIEGWLNEIWPQAVSHRPPPGRF